MIFTGSDALNIGSNHDSARRALNIRIYPLNLNEYLNLKCGVHVKNVDVFENMLFSGDIAESQKLEHEINYYYLLKNNINKNNLF